MTHNIYIYIAIMAGVSFLIRTPAADAHPQADYKPLSALVSVLCALCHGLR